MMRHIRVACMTLSAALWLSSCGGELIVSPTLVPRPVVHAVLDPGRSDIAILVARTRVNGPRYDPSKPLPPVDSILDQPETGVRVVIYGPSGDSAVAHEDTVQGRATGIYRIINRAVAPNAGTSASRITLLAGARYRMAVHHSLGLVTGTTIVPSISANAVRARATVNIERDTVEAPITIPANAGGLVRSYEGDFGVGSSLSAAVQGRIVMPLPTRALQPLLGKINREDYYPGAAFDYIEPWRHAGQSTTLAISAVDSNYFRFYRNDSFDPFGEDTPGNRLTGGVGLFGSISVQYRQTIDLVGTLDQPHEGPWVANSLSALLPRSIILYEISDIGSIVSSIRQLAGSGSMADGIRVILRGSLDTRTGGVILRMYDLNGGFLRSVSGSTANGLSLSVQGSTTQVVYRKG